MDLGLTDKVALVTAASRGLGYAIAPALLAEGAKVVISARNNERLDAAANELRATNGGGVTAIRADCTRLDDVESLVCATNKEFGRIDILVNYSAGPPTKPFVELADDDWRGALEVKFLPQVRCARTVFPGIVSRHSFAALDWRACRRVYLGVRLVDRRLTMSCNGGMMH